MKKIAIIGSGTAASLTAAGYYHDFKNDCEIEIYHDPKVNIEPVGQATVLTVPRIGFHEASRGHPVVPDLHFMLKMQQIVMF